jgi:hydrogenase maturation protease
MDSPEKKTPKTLILGLGNELLGDDGVGIMVVQELRRCLCGRNDLDFVEASVAGLALLDLLRGYRNVVVVDAIQTGGARPGQIYRLSEEDFCATESPWSQHQMGLRTVLEMGRRCGCSLPGRVVVYAVEVADAQSWRRGCTREVREVIPEVVQQIVEQELCGDYIGSTDEPRGER